MKLRDYAIAVTTEMSRVVNQYQKRPEVPKAEREGTMAYLCDVWVRLMAPMTPHMCEEFWSKMGKDGYISLAAWPKVDKKLIDKSMEQSQEVVVSTIRDIREITKLIRDQTPKTVHIYVAADWMFKAMKKLRADKVSLEIGKIMKHLMSDPEFRQYGKQVKGLVDRIAKENGLWDHSKSSKVEMVVLTDSADYISSEVGMKVVVHKAEKPDYDPQNKARFALPGRVSLFLE
jgi:leucyl-tRNA synthetase